MPPVSSARSRFRTIGRGFALLLLAVVALAAAVIVGGRGYAMLKLTQTGIEPIVARESADWPGATPRTLVIGDSRVARWHPEANTQRLRLATSGVGGETSGQLLARWQRSASPPPGTTVVIMTGVNDLVAADLNPDRAATIERALVANVATLAAQMRTQQLSPVIGTVGQASKIDLPRRVMGWSDELYALIDRTNAKLVALTVDEGYGLLDTNRALATGDDRRIAVRFATDTLHWNDAAYRSLEAALAAAEGQPE